MKAGETLYVKSGGEWRSWLKRHSRTKKEIWLIYYKKQSGKPRISYDDAVEGALCFGWIDGIVKRIDDEKFMQRFTPRRRGSGVSELNKERIRRLAKNGKMERQGFEAIAEVFDLSKDKASDLKIAPDVLKRLKSNEKAWKNFQAFPDYYKKIRIAYVETGRRSEENFLKRLDYFIRMTEKNKRFGTLK